MIRRKQDSPTFNLKALRLPARPKVVELRTKPFTNLNGDEHLWVWVVVDSLTKEQRTDFSWTVPVRRAICRALERMQDERFPTLLIRLKSEMDAELETE